MHHVHPLGTPGRRLERICEVLRLAGDLTAAKLHNADREDRPTVVVNHILCDPEVTFPDHPPDHESPRPGRVVAAERLHVVSPADALPRLGILDDDVVAVDLVFSVLISRGRSGPVPLQRRPSFPVLHDTHLSCVAERGATTPRFASLTYVVRCLPL